MTRMLFFRIFCSGNASQAKSWFHFLRVNQFWCKALPNKMLQRTLEPRADELCVAGKERKLSAEHWVVGSENDRALFERLGLVSRFGLPPRK